MHGGSAAARADEENEREMEREKHTEKEAEKEPQPPQGQPRREHSWRGWRAALTLQSADRAADHCDEVSTLF